MTVCRWTEVHKANKLMNQMGQKNAPLVMSNVTPLIFHTTLYISVLNIPEILDLNLRLIG